MTRSLLGSLVLVSAALALAAPTCPSCRSSTAAIEARLRANGFDPKDPNLATKLKAFAYKETAGFRPAIPTKLTLPAIPHGVTVESLTIGSASALSQGGKTRLMASGASPTPRPLGGNLNPRIIPGPTQPPQPRPYLYPNYFSLGAGILDFPGEFLEPSQSTTLAMRFDLGSCGKRDVNVPNSSIKTWPFGQVAQFPFPQFAVTSQTTNSLVTAVVSGTASNAIQFPYTQTWNTTQDQNIYATIHWWAPPRLQVFDFHRNVGLAEGTSVLYSSAPARASFTPFDPNSGGSGEDFLGRGIFLENGWMVQPYVMFAHSYQDSPNYTAPCDANRCAKIEALPQNGRIEVKVAWSYAPGESIDYEVGWGVAGPYGLRPYSTVSKQSTCGGEQ